MNVFPGAHGDIQPEAFYTRYFPTLVTAATTQFALKEAEAEDLADAILTASIRHLPLMHDVQAWLLAALTAAATKKAGAS